MSRDSSASYAELEQLIAERQHALSTLLTVTQKVASTLKLQPLVGLILEQLRQVVDYDVASLSVLESEQELVLLEVQGEVVEPIGTRFDLRQSPTVQSILRSGRPQVIPDIQADNEASNRLRATITSYGKAEFARALGCWMGVPLIARDKAVGLMILGHYERGYFTPDRVELALAFANQAAVAIENARLFAAEQRRAEQFRIISELGQRITSILDVDELLTQTAQLLRDTFGYYHVHIGLVEDDVLTYRETAGTWQHETCCTLCFPLRVGRDGIAGRVAGLGEAYLAPDVSRDPFFIPLAPAQSGSELALPLKLKGNTIGVLSIESDRVNAFDSTDIIVLQALANHLAIAIENARLYARSQQLAALEERQKLARELHDSVSQALYGIALGARTARTQLDRDTALVAEPLDYVLSLAEAGLAEMRALIFELRPESLELEGLVVALTKQASSLRARHRLEVNLALNAEPALPMPAKEALYRIAQEAMNNTVKHAQASRVTLRLTEADGQVQLEISDDGVGFNPEGEFPGHLGLRSMRERAERLGGELTVRSAVGSGTRIAARLPVMA